MYFSPAKNLFPTNCLSLAENLAAGSLQTKRQTSTCFPNSMLGLELRPDQVPEFGRPMEARLAPDHGPPRPYPEFADCREEYDPNV